MSRHHPPKRIRFAFGGGCRHRHPGTIVGYCFNCDMPVAQDRYCERCHEFICACCTVDEVPASADHAPEDHVAKGKP